MTPPRYADDAVILCDLAQHLLAERIAKYPAVVARGGMTQAQADDGIRTMRAVATRWTMIPLRDLANPRPAATDIASEHEMRATLAAASARTAQIAAADPDNRDKADYAQAVAALLWHAEHAVAAHVARWTPDARAA